jgi:hypothetical protein
MKPLLVMLLLAASVQAQSLADAARQERERQAKLHATIVIKEIREAPPAPTNVDQPKQPNRPSAVDPIELWNAKADQLRAKIKSLQDQETALQLQRIEKQSLVYAPVVDPAAKDAAQAELTQTIQDLAKVNEDLDLTKTELDAMMAAGPPKKQPSAQLAPSPQPRP